MQKELDRQFIRTVLAPAKRERMREIEEKYFDQLQQVTEKYQALYAILTEQLDTSIKGQFSNQVGKALAHQMEKMENLAKR
ncbi:hypothetical protein STRDD13_00713 [Streptococcus sp. DD13]|nr:hypothetical protein STRDD13_00713 [Streptococcus sp. DD13]